MGDTGPCGPCSELSIDFGPTGSCENPACDPACDCGRWLEFWNLVFMQYDRSADGSLASLPSQNIDTGAGLERIAAILQDVPSVFDTDAFRPLIGWAESRSGRAYGVDARDDRAFRVLADHARGMTFLATDGVLPGNEGRGYVLRRIVRRAVSEAAHLGLPPEDVVALTAPVVDAWSDAYPELSERAGAVRDVIGEEAEQFARTLAQGRRLLGEVINGAPAGGRVSGDDAFRLHDTYGFPLDLTVEAARDAGLEVDVEAFELAMSGQRERSRSAARHDGDATDLGAAALAVAGAAPPAEFVGYERLRVEDAEITAAQDLGEGRMALKLDRSPFYAEGGGQVSDGGSIAGPGGRARVDDVLRLGEDQVIVASVDGALAVGDVVHAHVDGVARRATQANHTATHILNWALRSELGDGVRQAGSYVGPDKLRFDFTHRNRIPAEQLERIERMVNDQVREDAPVVAREMSRDEADAHGAIGLFEEKYGERVRVLATGDFSRELCGGTHVSHTGEIGPFKLVSEGSTGAGARRVEAVTGQGALEWYRERERQLEDELVAREARIRGLEAELRAARSGKVDVSALAAGAVEMGAVTALAAIVDAADADELMAVSDRLVTALGDGAAVVLGAAVDGRAVLVANFAEDAVASGLSAGEVVKAAAQILGGGGGGKPGMARAGGKDPALLPDALRAAQDAVGAAARVGQGS